MAITNVAGDTIMNKKKTKGKQKIEKKKILNPNSRQVTFSKRRTGLFKKAAEICVLTGAQIAILVTSPGGRVYGFRYPNTDVILDRYLNDDNNDATTINAAGAETGTTKNYQPPPPTTKFNQHYVEVSRELEAEKKRGQTIPVSSGGSRWYDEPVDGLDVEELQQYLCSLEELKKKVLTRADEVMMISKSSAFFSSNAYDQMGWNTNNMIQPPYISTNTGDDGGFNFQNVEDFSGNFS